MLSSNQAPSWGWLDDPEVFRVNQLPAHSDHPFDRPNQPLRQTLNGEWAFRYFASPADLPCAPSQGGDWATITVPGHINLAGYTQNQYVNYLYPWTGHYFRRPAHLQDPAYDGAGSFSAAPENPVGMYQKRFTVPADWADHRVRVQFAGAESAIYVWLNDQFIGYAEDSFTPSEFDLTAALTAGDNTLTVACVRYCAGSYLEDQDFFRFFGLFRDVALVATPPSHVEDIAAVPTLQADGRTGSLAVTLTLPTATKGDLISLELLDPAGASVASTTIPVAPAISWSVLRLPAVHPWSHHTPALYALTVTVRTTAGAVREISHVSLGFRTIVIDANRVIRLNGERLRLLGVNRHEWDAHRGRAITEADMQADLAMMQANHINAVRTCHYPDQLPWYRMCDEAGIYVMAETNLESHNSWQAELVEPSYNVPGKNPAWREIALDRARSQYELLKNHPAILFWSLGNESYVSHNIEAMNTYYHRVDPLRLTHYEGVVHNRDYEDTVSDVESRMYPSPTAVADYLAHDPKKPVLLCEFAHNMGESIGGLDRYMALFDYPQYAGGFIWDFIDQALAVYDPRYGKEVLRYGGDFDDRPNNAQFSGDGLCFADRTAKPAMQEVRYYYAKYAE